MCFSDVWCAVKWGPKTARAHAKKTKQKTTSQMQGQMDVSYFVLRLKRYAPDFTSSAPDLMPSYSKGVHQQVLGQNGAGGRHV